MKKIISLIIVCSSLFLMACFSKSSNTSKVIDIVISGASSVRVGETITLSSNVNGGIWSSSNEGVATIDPSGLLTGISEGSVQVTYSVNGRSSSRNISVTSEDSPSKFILYSSEVGLADGLNLTIWEGNSKLDTDINEGDYSKILKVTEDGSGWSNVVIIGFDSSVTTEFDKIRFKGKSSNGSIKLHVVGKEKVISLNSGTDLGDGWYQIEVNFSELTGSFGSDLQIGFIGEGAGVVFSVTDIELIGADTPDNGGSDDNNEEPLPIEGIISLFNSNDQSEDIAVADWNPNWGQGGSLTEEEKDGVTVKKLHLVDYQGISIDEANGINITGRTTLHMDIWTADGEPFNVYAISGGSDGPAVSTGELTPNQWNIVKLDFSGATDITKIIQLKFDGGTDKVYYLDNIYFDQSENENPVNPAIGPLYTAEDGAIHTNISVPDWGNGSTITNLEVAKDGYDNVLEVSMGDGWGGASAPNGMSAAVAFGGFEAGALTGTTEMSIKFKYTNTNDIPQNLEIKMIGATNDTVVVHETGVGGTWTELSNDWIEVKPNLSEFGNLSEVTQIVFIVKDDASNPVYFTDIYIN